MPTFNAFNVHGQQTNEYHQWKVKGLTARERLLDWWPKNKLRPITNK